MAAQVVGERGRYRANISLTSWLVQVNAPVADRKFSGATVVCRTVPVSLASEERVTPLWNGILLNAQQIVALSETISKINFLLFMQLTLSLLTFYRCFGPLCAPAGFTSE